MGYAMQIKGSKFTILKENKEKALELLHEFVRKNKNLDWICRKDVLLSKSISEALEMCRYIVEEDNKDNIVDIEEFIGQKIGNDEKIFNAIAPAVENGSYIEMLGEDGDIWRWVFNGNTCKQVQAKIMFE